MISAATALAVILVGLVALPPVRSPANSVAIPTAPPPQEGASAFAPPPSTGDAGAIPGRVPPDAAVAPPDALPTSQGDALAMVDVTPSTKVVLAADGASDGAAGHDPFAHAGVADSSSARDGEGGAGGGGAASETGDAKENREPADCTLADKEIAREAWRRNWPVVCVAPAGDKASLLIPLKGTLDGETHEVRHRGGREVRINLPSGESLLTMRQYKLRRAGFVDLRILPWEGKGHGTRLRLKLQPGEVDPVLEIKDGYAKITLDTPPSSAP